MHSLRTDAETGNPREFSRRVNGGRAASYLLVLLLLLVSWADLAAGVELPNVCTVTNNATKEHYDLRGLMRESKDWEVKAQEGDLSYTFYLHVCGKIESSSDIVQNRDEMGVYLKSVSNDGAGKSLGKYVTNPSLQGKKPILKYTGGSKCHGSEDVRYTTIIAFTCDSGVGEDNPPVFLGSSNDCGFFFEWSTPFACASYLPEDGKSGWSVFFTIFIIAILVYVIGGVAYNRSVYSATGMSQLPHAEFWVNVWDFVKDMSLILVYQLPCFKPAVHTRSYRNLPRDEEAELMDDNFGED